MITHFFCALAKIYSGEAGQDPLSQGLRHDSEEQNRRRQEGYNDVLEKVISESEPDWRL